MTTDPGKFIVNRVGRTIKMVPTAKQQRILIDKIATGGSGQSGLLAFWRDGKKDA